MDAIEIFNMLAGVDGSDTHMAPLQGGLKRMDREGSLRELVQESRAEEAQRLDEAQAVSTQATKAQAHYTRQGKAGEQCGACKNFLSPGGCALVEGKISRRGSCSFFARGTVSEEKAKDEFIRHCVAKVAKDHGGDTSRAFAICTATGQKAGYYRKKEGGYTRQLTKKGKRKSAEKATQKGHKAAAAEYERVIDRKKPLKEDLDSTGLTRWLTHAAERIQIRDNLVMARIDATTLMKLQREAAKNRFQVETGEPGAKILMKLISPEVTIYIQQLRSGNYSASFRDNAMARRLRSRKEGREQAYDELNEDRLAEDRATFERWLRYGEPLGHLADRVGSFIIEERMLPGVLRRAHRLGGKISENRRTGSFMINFPDGRVDLLWSREGFLLTTPPMTDAA